MVDKKILKRLREVIDARRLGDRKEMIPLRAASIYMDVNYTTLVNYYNGVTEPTCINLKKICEWANCSADYILFGKESVACQK